MQFLIFSPVKVVIMDMNIHKINFGNCEATKIVIHHSKATMDSRNSTLVALYRTTGKCDCKKYYLGNENKLLRISPIS